jgi:hypothetical protein
MRFAWLFVLTACGSTVHAPPSNTGGVGRASIRAVDFASFTYTRDGSAYTTVDGTYDFVIDSDGKNQPADYVPRPDEYVDHASFAVFGDPAYGDLDGDGHDEAAVITVLNTGGTGMFDEVDLYRMGDTGPVLMGTIPGGDRGDGGIAAVEIEGRTVEISRMQSQPGDGACCPSMMGHEAWHWKGDAFVEDVAARYTGQLR